MSQKTYKPGDWVRLISDSYISKDKYDIFRVSKVSGGHVQKLYHDGLLPVGKQGWISADHVELANHSGVFINIMNLAYKYGFYHILNNEDYFQQIWIDYHE